MRINVQSSVCVRECILCVCVCVCLHSHTFLMMLFLGITEVPSHTFHVSNEACEVTECSQNY